MSCFIKIPILSQSELGAFCADNDISPALVARLSFAILLHQYFDLSDFSWTSSCPNDRGHTALPLVPNVTRIEYKAELAATTTIQTALRIYDGKSQPGDVASLLSSCAATQPSIKEHSREDLNACVIVHTTADPENAPLPSSSSPDDVFGLVLQFHEESLSAELSFKVDLVSAFLAENFVDAFATTLQSIATTPVDTTVANLNTCGAKGRELISNWNQHSTSTPNKLLHDLVGRGFRHKPDATAILSWEEKMSWSQLDKRSSSLAAYLMETYRTGPNIKVALCFEKCIWAIVSMLAVLKSGAAYCCLDPSHPRARHEYLIHALEAPVVLTSALYEGRFKGYHVLVPTEELVSHSRQYLPTDVQPNDTCMVAFTSGSTGNPKGIVHTHNSLVTGIVSNAGPQYLDREGVSTFQWSAFTFDVSMIEIYAPLIYGGRICIPSDDERVNHVEESMNRMAVNWAYFTPSFARLFAQYSIPTLQTLLMGGEVVTAADINAWNNRVRVIHSYGPAESATFFLAEIKGPCPKIVPIGPAPNTHAWIVNPSNHEVLSPVGAVGEMVYESPGLLKEYLGDPVKSKQALIDAPHWRKSLNAPQTSSKLYKSGDLVRYLSDGTMMYIGRKDTMVKLRGQKLEVGEVESTIRKSLGGSRRVAVDLVNFNHSGPRLVAFLEGLEERTLSGNSNGGSYGGLLSSNIPGEEFSTLTKDLRSHLIHNLPDYMVPRIFLSIAKLPTNSNGKLDRAKLKDYARNLPTNELLKYSDSGFSRDSLTDIPVNDTLALEISDILVKILSGSTSKEETSLKGKNASLEKLGLDSLSTVSFARSINQIYGLSIPIKVFRQVDLDIRDLAEIVRGANQGKTLSDDLGKAEDILQDINVLDGRLARLERKNSFQSGSEELLSESIVFLTGATGFLGTQILRQLLARADVSKVIVLVRAKDVGSGLNRIVTAGTMAGWWNPAVARRVEVWLGDLAKPRLGVSEDQWARLEGTCANESEAVTTIIHNGAVVNWSLTFEKLRATNVVSTVQLLEIVLACTGRLRHFTYISGGDMHLSENAVISDSTRLSVADGYSQSKFASDMIVQRCIARANAGQRINMVKPGIIIGTATEGISNTDDYIWRVAAGVCEAGVFVDGERDALVCLAGADRVAQCIIQTCLDPLYDGNDSTGVTRMTEGIAVGDFWETVSKGTGAALQAADTDTWFKIVNANVSQKNSSHLLWPVMEWVEQRKGRIGDPRLFRCKADSCIGHCLSSDVEQDDSEPNFQCQHGTDTKRKTLQALRKSVEYLSRLGFLRGDSGLSRTRQDVFSRSGLIS